MERDRGRRYDDGEVTRYGAGESWRPTPRRGDRSPVKDRDRDRDRNDRARTPPRRDQSVRRSPPPPADCYVPNRSPRRRRSRSAERIDRYQSGRDRSRDAERWRRDRSRSRARSPVRRISPARRSPPRRSPPRFNNSPRRDDRARSPPRRDQNPPRDMRRRSRSPFDRDRGGDQNRGGMRNRSPLRRSPPPGPRIYRPRSRSPDRRDSRYSSTYRRPSPPRDSNISSALTSRSASGRSSPRPTSRRGYDDRSRPESPAARSPATAQPGKPPIRESTKPAAKEISTPGPRSPPRGPAALRGPMSSSRTYSTTRDSPAPSSLNRQPPTPTLQQQRSDLASPTAPPAGPRGFAPSRGGAFAPRGGGRAGSWGALPARHSGSTNSPAPSNSGGIPTGPRAGNHASTPSPVSTRPFNPPTGPAAQIDRPPRQQMTLAQQLINGLPPIIPGGKIDPASTPLTTGVLKELEPHHRRLKDEEERMRQELDAKQEKLRKQLRIWDRLERESKAWELKAQLSEQSLNKIAGEGVGGAAF